MPWQVPITVDGLEYPVTFNTEGEPSQQDYDDAVQQILSQKAQAAPAPEQETPGYLSQLGSALGLGYRQMKSGVGATFNALTGDMPDVAAEMAEMSKLQREQQALQTPEDVAFMRGLDEAEKAYDKASGPLETIGALAEYPAAVLAQPGAAFKTAIQSAPNALISGATSLAGYGLGGLAGGAAGIETGPGAILTGIAGAMAGGAVSNTLMEAGPAIFDVLNERTQGAASNMTADEISAYLQQNPDVVDEGMKTGAIRGSVIGAIEALGVKGSGRLLTMPERAAARAVQKELVAAGVDVASKEAVDEALLDPALKAATKAAADAAKSQFSSAGNIARMTGAAAIDTGSAGVGEIAAQAAASQDISTKEAFMEMLGDAALSLPMAAATKTVEGAQYMFRPEEVAVKLSSAAANDLNNADSPLAAAAADKFTKVVEEIVKSTEPAVPPVKTTKAVEVPDMTGLSDLGETEGDLVGDFGLELRGIQQEARQPAETLFELPPPQKRNLGQLRDAVIRQMDETQALAESDQLSALTPEYDRLLNKYRRLETLLGKIEAKMLPPSLPETGMQPVVDKGAPAVTTVQAATTSNQFPGITAMAAQAAANLRGEGRISPGLKAAIPQQTPAAGEEEVSETEQQANERILNAIKTHLDKGESFQIPGNPPTLIKAKNKGQFSLTKDGKIRFGTGKKSGVIPSASIQGIAAQIGERYNPLDYVTPLQEERISPFELLKDTGYDGGESFDQMVNILGSPEKAIEEVEAMSGMSFFDTWPIVRKAVANGVLIKSGKQVDTDAFAEAMRKLASDAQSLEGKERADAMEQILLAASINKSNRDYAIRKQPITPQGTPTPATEGMRTPGGVGTKRDATKPEQMTPEEFSSNLAWTTDTKGNRSGGKLKKGSWFAQTANDTLPFGSSDSDAPIYAVNKNELMPIDADENDVFGQEFIKSGSFVRSGKKHSSLFSIPRLFAANPQKFLVNQAVRDGKTVSAAAVDTYGIELPEGYGPNEAGDLYVFQPGATGEPVQAAPSAAQAVKATAPGPIQKPVTQGQIQAKIQELLRAPTKGTKKPAVSFKTQTEENAFARGFQAATERQGEPPPARMPNRSPKDQKWDEAWHKGWASGQTFIRSLPSPTSIEQQPQTATVATQTETAAPSAKGAAVASGAERQPSGGSIPEVAPSETQETQPSTKENDAISRIDRLVSSGAKPEEMDKFVKSLSDDEFNALVESEAFDVDTKLAIKPKDTYDAKRIKRRKFVDQINATAVQARKTAEQIFKEEEAELERQRKIDERTQASLKSIIDPEKTNIVQGTVSAADAESARRALNNSGEIPNAFLTRIYASPEAFLADRANQRYFPSSYARLQSEGNIEGLFERGQTLIFADKIGVSDLDRRIGKNLGISPEQAAARRVIAHENGHRSVALFTSNEKREFLGYLRRKYNDAQIDNIVRVYSEYADWRTNLESRNEALEELFLKDFERLEKIPTGGIWDDIVQFLKRVWRRLTGRTDDPTLDNMKDVVRLLRNAMRRIAVPSYTTKDGGEVKLSLSDRFQGVTPAQDAEYLAAVQRGDMATAQRMVDEAAKAAGYNVGPVWHGSAEQFREFDKARWGESDEGYLGAGFYFTNKPEVAQWYTKGSPNASIYRVFLKQKRPASIGMVNGKRADIAQYAQDLTGQIFDRYDRSPEMSVKITQSLQRFGIDGIDYTFKDGSKELTVFEPSAIKSADPVTYDDAGSVIPLSQRFNTALPDIRFSRVEYASDYSAASSAGAQLARDTVYDDRIIEMRDAIRRAYEQSSTEAGVAMPLDELYAKAKELAPDMTENEFGNILQDLYEDNGAVLQEGATQISGEPLASTQNLEKDNPFNELIRKSSSKSPSIGEINSVSKKFITRFIRPDSSLARQNDIRIDGNATLQARALPDGGIVIGYSLSQDSFDGLQKMAPQAASQYTKDAAIEELVHLSDLIGLKNQWLKSGKQIPFNQFVLNEQSNLAFSLIQQADSMSDSEAESLRKILASSLSLYDNNADIAKLGLNELLDLAAQNSFVLPELIRSLIQLKKTGQITETAFRKIANVLRQWQETVLQWLVDGYSSARDGVFGEMLSERIKNAEANLEILSGNTFDVFTPEGRRAGFAVIMPKRAVASRVETEGEAVKSYQDGLEAIESNMFTAKFGGRKTKGVEPTRQTIKPNFFYKQASIQLVDDLLKDKYSIEDIANSLMSDEFLQNIGIKNNVPAIVSLTAEVKKRLSNEARSEKDLKRKVALEKLFRKLVGFDEGVGNNAGRGLGIRSYITNDPRYRWMYIYSKAEEQLRKDRELAATRVASDLPQTADNLQKTDAKIAEEADEQVMDDVEESEDEALFREGEAAISGKAKSLWEKAKDLLRKIAFLDRLDKKDASAKASLSEADKNELSKLSKEERAKKRAEFVAELEATLEAFLGKDSNATTEQKATRKKMVATAKKRAEQGKSIDVSKLEGDSALAEMIRAINKARPGEKAPLKKQIPWRKLLSQKASTVETYRQRIFDAISSEESLADLDDAQKTKLADLFTQAWESKRKAILNRMVDNAISQEQAAGRLTKEGADALRSQRQKLVEDINLGILDEDRLMKHLADKFGIKSEFTEAERANIDRLLDILQDDKLNEVKRNKAAYELLEALSSATKIPIAKLLADYWVSSVLSGVNTAASIAMAVMSGGYELTTGAFRILRAGFTNPKELPAEIAASFKAMAEFLKAFGREGRLAWQYLVTGDRAFLDPSMNTVLNDLNYDSIGKTVSLAEKMAKSDKILQRVMGIWMRSVSRLLTALDSFNSGVTKAGALPIVFRQLNLSAEDLQRATEKYNLQLYRDRVIERDFNGNKPTTAHDKALVDSYAKAEMMADLKEFGKFSENADFFGQQGAMTLDPTGIGGFIYSSIKSLTGGATTKADKFLAEAEREWKQADGADKTAKGLQLAFAYFLQFGAYNSANLAGLRFARFAGNKFNQGLSFIPGIGMWRMYEATVKDSKIEAKEAFTDMILRNQTAGVLFAIIGGMALKAIADEPDDEKRGFFWNGGWANLTPDRKQQKLAAGQKEYTIGIPGVIAFNYQNWPISPIMAAIGSLSDLIRFSPEQWNEKAMADRIVSAAASGVFSAAEIPALSGFQTLFGNNLSSKDPNEKRLDRFAKVMAGWGGGFVPRILKDIDFMADPGLRKYETLWEQTASHIPVYRRYSGEEYYDILGKQIERKVWPGSREFMELETDPEYRTLGKLNSRGIWLTPANAEHRMVGKGRNKRKLTQEEADAYSLETGKGYRQMLLRYGSRLEQMPTERARAFLMDKADEVRDRALKKIVR